MNVPTSRTEPESAQPEDRHPENRDMETAVKTVASRHMVVGDREYEFPYSKGLMASAIMATGLAPARAFHVAEVIEERLDDQAVGTISRVDLNQLAMDVLRTEVGDRYAESFSKWQLVQRLDLPLVILLGGATGVGKSTIATMLASRLGITRVIPTDAVREVMRSMFTAALFSKRARSRKPGTMCAPSMMRSVPSDTARLTRASMPTDTADVCSRKPMITGSALRGSGWRTRRAASNDEVCRLGNRSAVNIDRMTSRMASVGMTRVMPSRLASMVAMVDLPTPVAPPSRITSGRSRRCTICHLENDSA